VGLNCSICAHKKHKEIDKALVGEKPNFSAIARIFDVDRGALKRHLENGHVAEKIAKAAGAQEALDADDLLNEIHRIESTTETIITAAMATTKKKVKTKEGIVEIDVPPDHETALKGLARREKQIELKGKVLGAFKGEKPPSESGKLTVKILKGVSMDDL
jgi:hypothetical protein